VAVHQGDCRRIGVRVEHLEIGMRHDPQHLVRRIAGARPADDRERQPEKGYPQKPIRHSIPVTG